MAAVLLEPGSRLLHIGPHKTGTTAIQGALHLARERLAAEGVVYPGRGRQPLWPILAVTGQPALLGGPRPEISYWDSLVRDVRNVRAAGDQRVVLSSEFFAEADDATARRVVADLGGARVHVVVTLRSLTRILPSQWQQYLQNGFHFGYLEWLEGILSEPPQTPTPGFWRRHRHDALIARWAAENGPENLTVIVLDESDRLMLLRVFESMLGLPAGFLVPEERAVNRSLTAPEAELVRLLNSEFSRRGYPHRDYARFMRYGAVEHMKDGRRPSADEPKIATPAWALARAAEISGEMAGRIDALGVNIVGDIASLGKLPADGLDLAPGGPGLAADGPDPAAGDASAPPMVPVEAAVRATIGAFIAGGAGGQTAEEIVRDLDTMSLAKVLADRCRRRVRRVLPG
jgi:hypothetical protein